ncbi:MAG: hypothetical protein HGA31_01460 [Candidatus Moranbacteria bacterium]|nr:hypothetical protein [Candidatus Moranbacteria bacterium]
MDLLHAFENGRVDVISGLPDRVVETILSRLFFFEDRIFKVYKWRNGSIGDFTDPEFRSEFFRDDFTWNVSMSPDTYVRLGFVAKRGGRYYEVHESEAEDFFIEMNRINQDEILFELLKCGKISEKDLRATVVTMFDRLGALTESVRDLFPDIFSIPLPELHLMDMQSTREWIRMTDDFPFHEEAGIVSLTLERFIASHRPFREFETKRYCASIDNHAGNIVFSRGETKFIDSMPPMRIWRAQTPLYILSRPATDVEVLIGKELSDAMYEEYSSMTGVETDPLERSYCQAVSALIMAPYMHSLHEKELSRKYLDFAKEKISELDDRVSFPLL